MNDDLILRARLHHQGWSDDQIEKYIGQGLVQGAKQKIGGAVQSYNQGRAAGHQGASLGQRFLPGGKQRYMDASGKTEAEYGQEMDDQAAAKQQEARNAQAARMQGKGVVPSTGAEAPKMAETVKDPATGQQTTRTNLAQATVGDGSQTGTPAIPDSTTTTVQNGPDGQPNQIDTKTTVNANAGNEPAQSPAIDPTAQAAAQQGMVAQDLATVQQGKGADKQSWMKNRSGFGKIMDIATFGATAGIGSTGAGARRQANQQSQEQTQNYNQAQQRLQRTAGFAKSMSFYRDVISQRQAIQERNTTRNLRR